MCQVVCLERQPPAQVHTRLDEGGCVSVSHSLGVCFSPRLSSHTGDIPLIATTTEVKYSFQLIPNVSISRITLNKDQIFTGFWWSSLPTSRCFGTRSMFLTSNARTAPHFPRFIEYFIDQLLSVFIDCLKQPRGTLKVCLSVPRGQNGSSVSWSEPPAEEKQGFSNDPDTHAPAATVHSS